MVYFTELLGGDTIEELESLVNDTIPVRVSPNFYQVRLSMFWSQADVDADDQIWSGEIASPASF